jgi:hypothetical protein
MGHTLKGQTPSRYIPSVTRRASGLSPIQEATNARRRWNILRQAVRTASQIQRNIRSKGTAKRGRFTVKRASPVKTMPKISLWKNTPSGVYFVSEPYKKGRFTIENIRGFVPMPKKSPPKR